MNLLCNIIAPCFDPLSCDFPRLYYPLSKIACSSSEKRRNFARVEPPSILIIIIILFVVQLGVLTQQLIKILKNLFVHFILIDFKAKKTIYFFIYIYNIHNWGTIIYIWLPPAFGKIYTFLFWRDSCITGISLDKVYSKAPILMM